MIEVDKLHLVHRVVNRLRAMTWCTFARLVMKRPSIGHRILCIGWPTLSHRNGQLKIGDNVSLGRGVLKVTKGAKLCIGASVQLNHGFVIAANECVEIGEHTLIGEYVSIRDGDHIFNRNDIPIGMQGTTTEPIRIGRDVWIGRGAVILKGVTIGDGAIIGANSVVTRDVPSYDIVAGVPARHVSSRDKQTHIHESKPKE
jgi:acetyltransferase-like isoleucine patch superfamily enzyme